MSGNIVSAVSQFLTPDLVAKIASASGISDGTAARKALGAAVPAILSSFAALASKPGGERQLADAVAKQPPGALENLANTVGGSGQSAIAGENLLSSLLGGSSFGSLANVIGKFTGLGEGAMRSILGMLTPVILGVLGREAGAGASGLKQLLTSQKDNFAAAMPAGLSNLLQAGGLQDGMGAAASAASRATATYRSAREGAGRVVDAVSPTGSASSSGWAYWALPIVALAGLAWYFWGGEDTRQPVAEAPSQTKTATQPAAPGAIVGTNLQSQIASAIASLNGTLRGVKDQASATEALPKLQQASSELERLNGLAARLPFEARDRLAETNKAATAQLKTALDTVNAMPGLASDVQPVIASLQGKLETLAMTPRSLAQQRIGGLAATYLTRSPSGAVAISLYFDRNVHNGADERIGTVSDLIVGPDGKITAAVIGVGGFLGIGEKEVAVPFSSMQIARRDNDWYLVIEGTRDALRDAPAYEDTGVRMRLRPAQK